MDKIPRMSPGWLKGKSEEDKKWKTPTDCWWIQVIGTNSKERLGYPTQKPMKLLERIIKVHSNPGDKVLDFFAGTGTTGEAAAKNGRTFILIDENVEAIEIMKKRLEKYSPKVKIFD